jgi:hypothetical protein
MSALSVICDDSRSVQKVRATTLASSRSCLSKMLGELLKSQPAGPFLAMNLLASSLR